jgi:hypothetical protein
MRTLKNDTCALNRDPPRNSSIPWFSPDQDTVPGSRVTRWSFLETG